MIADSNILIYSFRLGYKFLRDFLEENTPGVSIVTYVEVPGYHRLTEAELDHCGRLFESAEILNLTTEIAERAVNLRQSRRMSLGDAIIAATCLQYDRALVTRNVVDFAWISDLSVVNPFDADFPVTGAGA